MRILQLSLLVLVTNKLAGLMEAATPLHVGIGGHSVLVKVNGTQIFVKKIPLTDLERRPENIMSTANLFELPLCYQYGVGSTGFGAWRELLAHIMTTNWVLAGDCPSFPLLYHWRILPASSPEPMTAKQREDFERDVQYWENSPAISRRLEAIHHASTHILLFFEYVPNHLYQWLSSKITAGGSESESAVDFVVRNLKTTNEFINAHGLVHFDAHFENMLSDGKLIYFSDFGLGLSSKFDLTKSETEFLKDHHNYDLCSTGINLLHTIITTLFGKDNWTMKLQEYLNGERGTLAPSIDSVIKRHAPIAFAMDEFYRTLQKESKSVAYPKERLEHLLATIN